MRPSIRIVQGKLEPYIVEISWAVKHATYPTLGMSCRTTIGTTVPPIEPPKAIMDMVIPRLFSNQCPIKQMEGTNNIAGAIYKQAQSKLNREDEEFESHPGKDALDQ